MTSPTDAYSGTKPVAAQHAFDIGALQVHLQQHLDGFAGPLAVEQFKGGQSNPTFKLVTPGATYVMRCKPGPVAKLLPSAHAIEREFTVMRALRGTGVPVPTMHLLCEDESVIGRAFYVMEFVQGRVLWDQTLPGMSPAERGAIYDEMNRVIAALHTADFAAVGLAGYGQAGQLLRAADLALEQAVPRLDHRADCRDGPADGLAASATCRRARKRRERRCRWVHGDYRLDNFDLPPTTAPRILTRCWTGSSPTLGHPLADFSYHCMSWHIPPGAVPRHWRAATSRRWGFRTSRAYVQPLLRTHRSPRSPRR